MGPTHAEMPESERRAIRCADRTECYLCGHKGTAVHAGISDRLFSAPGVWSLLQCANRRCRLIWMSPMPVAEDIGMAYEGYYTHGNPVPPTSRIKQLLTRGTKRYLAARYGYQRPAGLIDFVASLFVRIDPGWRANAEFSAFYLDAQPDGRLLEVGCGNGQMLNEMKDLGWDVTGIDVDSAAVAQARSLGLKVEEGALEPGMFEEGSFDAVAMSHVIEHLHDPRTILRECLHVLRPGGKLVLVTPNTRSWGYWLFGRNWMSLDPPRHLCLFNRRNLTELVLEAGFSSVEGKTVPRDAKGTLGVSLMIRQHGEWIFGAPLPLWAKSCARILEAIEAMILPVFRDCGEEIVVTGRKP